MRTKKLSDPESGDRTSGVSSASVSTSSVGSARSSGTGIFSELDEHLSSLEGPVQHGVLVLHCMFSLLFVYNCFLVVLDVKTVRVHKQLAFLHLGKSIKQLLLIVMLFPQIYLRALFPVTTTMRTMILPPP